MIRATLLTEVVSLRTMSWRKSWNNVTNFVVCPYQSLYFKTIESTYFVQIVRSVSNWNVHLFYNSLNLIASSPLCVAWMAISSSDVLADFRSDVVEHEVIDWIYVIGEYELRPRKDAQLITHLIEIVDAGLLVGRLVDATPPDSKLVMIIRQFRLRRDNRLPCSVHWGPRSVGPIWPDPTSYESRTDQKE